MIRYATKDDISWIIALQEANPDVVINVIREDKLLEIVNNKSIIINESNDGTIKYSFLYYEVTPEYLIDRLIITDEQYRQQGYATALYNYLIVKYKLPVKYKVIANSEQEQIWAKRNEDVLSRHKLKEVRTSNGRTFHEYIVQLKDISFYE